MMRAVAGRGMKVLLSGQGGDELFGGYNWYAKHLFVSLLHQARMLELARELRDLPVFFPNNMTRSRSVLLASMGHAMLPIRAKLMLKPELRGMRDLLRGEFRKRMVERDMPNLRMLDPGRLEEKTQNDLLYCNVPQFLHYEDSNAMAFGIEERVPLLDHRLVEWAHKLAVHWKIHGGMTKYPLRQVMRKLLPEKITERRDKMGLSAPREMWLREELRSEIESMFKGNCRIYQEWIDRRKFLTELDRYMNKEKTHLSRLLWRCINLEKWLLLYG